MDAFVIELFSQGRSLLLLLTAIALTVAGIAFIAYHPQAKRELLSRRVGLVRPGFEEREVGAERRAAAREAALVRPGHALPAWQRELLRQASKLHLPTENASATILWIRAFSAAAMALLAPVLIAWLFGAAAVSPTPAVLLTLAAFPVAGWLLPNLVGRALLKRRTNMIEIALPDALELLVVCVEAGLSLEDAITRAAAELRSSRPEMAEELDHMSADLRILPSRDQALQNLAARIDLPSIHSVVTTLGQTMRYGTPLVQALRVAAADLRNESLIKLEERANKLPVLLTIPMMVFMMPAMFLIVVGPAALRLIDVFLR